MRTRLPRPRASTAPGFLVVALVLVGSLAACDDEPKSNVEPIDAAGADADADGVSGTDTIDADVAPETGSTGDSDAGGDAVADTDVTADAPADIEAGASDVAPDAEPDVGFDGVPVPIEEPEGYRDRRAEYLAWCVDRTDPGEGGLYGQCCRVYAGETDLDDGPIDSALAQLEERRDTADFRANGLVRLLYLDDATDAGGHKVYAGNAIQLSRLRAAWVAAQRALQQAGDAATKGEQPDIEAPLEEQTIKTLQGTWKSTCPHVDFDEHMTGADALTSRNLWEFRKKTHTLQSLGKVKAVRRRPSVTGWVTPMWSSRPRPRRRSRPS